MLKKTQDEILRKLLGNTEENSTASPAAPTLSVDFNKQEILYYSQEEKEIKHNGEQDKSVMTFQKVDRYRYIQTYHRKKGESVEHYLIRNRAAIFISDAEIIKSGVTDEKEIIERSRRGYLEMGRGGKYYNLPDVKKERERVLAVLDGAFNFD